MILPPASGAIGSASHGEEALCRVPMLPCQEARGTQAVRLRARFDTTGNVREWEDTAGAGLACAAVTARTVSGIS